MSHYIDIHLRSDPDLAPHQLLSGLYARLHQALVRTASQSIGVSFPRYDNQLPTLGTTLRLHGSQPELDGLMQLPWLHGVVDLLQVAEVRPVPYGAMHRVVSRVQAQSNAQRLRRRAIKRHDWDDATAKAKIPDSAEQRLNLPFLTLGSRSTGQASFPLFVRHGPLLPAPVLGVFNYYGLSQTATVPWF